MLRRNQPGHRQSVRQSVLERIRPPERWPPGNNPWNNALGQLPWTTTLDNDPSTTTLRHEGAAPGFRDGAFQSHSSRRRSLTVPRSGAAVAIPHRAMRDRRSVVVVMVMVMVMGDDGLLFRDPDHAPDTADDATNGAADNATNDSADRTGHALPLGHTFLAPTDDAVLRLRRYGRKANRDDGNSELLHDLPLSSEIEGFQFVQYRRKRIKCDIMAGARRTRCRCLRKGVSGGDQPQRGEKLRRS